GALRNDVDRNLLLAFALSFLVLSVWTMMQPPRPKPAAAPQAQQLAPPPPPEPGAARPARAAPPARAPPAGSGARCARGRWRACGRARGHWCTGRSRAVDPDRAPALSRGAVERGGIAARLGAHAIPRSARRSDPARRPRRSARDCGHTGRRSATR